MYVIRKDDAPVIIMFDDIAYDVDPEDCCINAMPMNGTVFKRDNAEVHKFLKYLTQGTKAWKWIEKFKGGIDALKALRDHYNGSDEDKRCMNTKTADLKELYFKCQEVSPFEKYVSRLKESYNTLEELNQTKFEEQK